MDNETSAANKYLFWGIIFITIFLSYLVLKGFLLALVSAFILAYLLKPIHEKLSKSMRPSIAAALTLGLTLIIFLTVVGAIVGSFLSEISQFNSEELLAGITENIEDLPYQETIKNYLSEITSNMAGFFIKLVSTSVSEIPGRALTLFVVIFTAYYLLMEGDLLKNKIKKVLPFKNKHEVMEKIERVIKDIIMGTFLLALIEAAIIAISFMFLGIKFALVLGFITGLFAFIPALGPMIVWVPVALMQFALGNVGTSIGVIIVGVIMSSYVDSIIRLKLIGGKSKIHPVIMLVGLLGGIQIFGLIGFIIGPLILSIMLTIIESIPKLE